MSGGRRSKVFFTFPPTHPMVGKLFVIMFECIFKFDGQIETACLQLDQVSFCNGPCITVQMIYKFTFSLREKA